MTDETSGQTPQLTRRHFLQGSALAGFGVFLAACTGVDSSVAPSVPSGASQAPGSTASIAVPTPPPVSPTATAAPTPKVVTGPLKFANWAAYIDLTGKADDTGVYAPGSSPTLEAFKKQYQVAIDYQEKIEDNPSFIQTIQPALVAGVCRPAGT